MGMIMKSIFVQLEWFTTAIVPFSVPRSWNPWSICSLIVISMVGLFSVPRSWIPWSVYGRDHQFHGQQWAWFTTAISWISFFFFFSVMSWISSCQLTNTVRMQVCGLFNFKKDHPRSVCRRQQCLRTRTAQNWSFQIVKMVPAAQATLECSQRRRSCAKHVSTLRGRWKVDYAMHMLSYHLLYNICSAILHWVPELPDCRCMISYMISWHDIVYDFMCLWYHKFLISYIQDHDIIYPGSWYHTWYHGPESVILSMISYDYDIISSWYHIISSWHHRYHTWYHDHDIVYDIIGLWYHKFLISQIQIYDIIDWRSWYQTWYHSSESMILSMISYTYDIISSWYHRFKTVIS